MKKTLKLLFVFSIFCFSYNTVSAQSYYNTYEAPKTKCFATTQSGYSCQNNAKSGSSYCGQHENKNVYDNGYRYTSTCQAIASSTWVQCRNRAKNGSMYCGSHD